MPSTPITELLKRPIAWKRWQTDRTVRRLLSSLQANIVKGHGRDHTVNMFCSFQGANPSKLRSVIRHLGAAMPSALEQLQATETFKATGQSGGPVLCFFLRPSGYAALNAANKAPTGAAFTAGMQARGPDPAININDPAVSAWGDGFREPIDAMLLVAADTEALAQQEAAHWRHHLQQAGAVLRRDQPGVAIKLPVADTPEGVEHFGYVDGRSQPLFLAEDVEREARAHWDPAFPPSQFLVDDPGDDEPTSFGSFFVFRKLEQNVAGFKQQEEGLAAALGLKGGPFEERAGALIVGRFEDGTPVVLDPMQTDMPPVNDFDFRHDEAGARCPFHSHIRKVNPRGESPLHIATDANFVTTVRQERGHIMARRGITYGERTFNEDKTKLTDAPSSGVGLLFMAYMASIENQFEFTQATWANNPSFVTANVGIDPVIGQASLPVPNPPTNVTVNDGWSGKTANFGFQEFVKMMGGEYFFAPSIDFLKHV